MARISKLTLEQVNLQLDKLDSLIKRVGEAEARVKTLHFQVGQLDFIHAKPTTNNLTFKWTGGGGGTGNGAISWAQGFIQDKNANAQLVVGNRFSSAKGDAHTYNIPAGTLAGQPQNSFVWIGWNYIARQMVVTTNAGILFHDLHMLVICQLFTGTEAAGLETIGGGGSQGGVDLSGARYKLV